MPWISRTYSFNSSTKQEDIWLRSSLLGLPAGIMWIRLSAQSVPQSWASTTSYSSPFFAAATLKGSFLKRAPARLTGAGTAAYGYNTGNDLTTGPSGQNQAFNSNDEICWSAAASASGSCASPPSGATTYTYNADGDRTQTATPTGNPTTYTWNANDELTGVTSPTGTSTSYTYDANGLLEDEATGTTTTKYTWDTQTSLPQLLADGTNYYIYGNATGPIEQVNATTGTTTYLLTDQLGSTRLLASNTGSITATYTYNPWGGLTDIIGASTTPFGYAGEYSDGASSLYYLRARWYDPGTGQFISNDPDLATTNSPYDYAADNPIIELDPSGESISHHYITIPRALELAGDINKGASVTTDVGDGSGAIPEIGELLSIIFGVLGSGAHLVAAQLYSAIAYAAELQGEYYKIRERGPARFGVDIQIVKVWSVPIWYHIRGVELEKTDRFE